MKKAVNSCVLATVFFALCLFILPLFSEMGSLAYAAAYALAFVLPASSVYFFSRASGARIQRLSVRVNRDGAALMLPLVLPTVGAVMLISQLTSQVMGLAEFYSAVELEGSLFMIFIMNALLPALGEELLFRFVPLSLIAPYSKKVAVLVSALLFALVHLNLFQLPYAFLAGLVFAALDLMCGSIFPSLVIHFVNNSLSVALMLYPIKTLTASVSVGCIFGALLLLSLYFIFRQRGRYKREISAIISHGSVHFTPGLATFCVSALIFSVITLF